MTLVLLLCAHIVAMRVLENMDWWTSVWLTFITVATVGYGDVSAKSVPGQVATLTLLVLPGIALFSKLLSDLVERNQLRNERKRKGEWSWKMKDHIIVMNPPRNIEPYTRLVVDEFQKHPDFEHSAVQVVSTDFPSGLPVGLQDKNILLYSASANSESALEAVKVEFAKVIIALASDPDDPNSDARTFDLIARIREMGSKAYIVAEVIDDRNRRRVRTAGANATMRPIRAYPEIAVRAVLAPGSELVIEELFDSEGSEYRTVRTPLMHLSWGEVVQTCVGGDFGTPLAWIREDGSLVINPVGSSEAHFVGFIMAVLDTANWKDEDLLQSLQSR